MITKENIDVKKPRCHNCKFAGKQFKVVNLTHLHCQDEKQFSKEELENGDISAWDTLKVFNDTCDNHEFKVIPIKKSITQDILNNTKSF